MTPKVRDTCLPHPDIIREAEAWEIMSAGAVGITALKDVYLIVVGNWDSERFDVYRTSGLDLTNPSTTVSAFLGSWIPGSAGHSYQTFRVIPYYNPKRSAFFHQYLKNLPEYRCINSCSLL